MRMCSTNYSMIGTLLPDISSVNAPTLAENGSRTWSSRGGRPTHRPGNLLMVDLG